MIVRQYKTSDYERLKALYLDSLTFGGQFDEARDAASRLQKKIESDPDAILVAEQDGELVGSVSIIDDGRVAWLFRFAVPQDKPDVVQALHDKAIATLKERDHVEVLVYTPVGNQELDSRYERLGFTRGGDYTCYWKGL
jgi:ribosomal protein S18 acetylase RimI-like enzyme